MLGVHQLLYNLSNRTLPVIQIAIASSASKSLFEVKTSHIPTISDAFLESYRVLWRWKISERQTFSYLALERINATLERHGGRKPVKAEECLVFEDSVAGVEA